MTTGILMIIAGGNRFSGRIASIILLITFFLCSVKSHAQYFGRNKPGYNVFTYDVLRTRDFDIYHNFKNDSVLDEIGQISEYWYKSHAKVFADTLNRRNPIILYDNQADFQQTNVSNSIIGVGTGGFTEGLRRRVVIPVSFTFGQTNHVIGHELVHVFQYNMMSVDSISLQSFSNLPLWMIEGMAEYLSIGSVDPLTSMWIRDDVVNKKFPSIDDLNKKPEYFPYRYGQAFWAYTGKTWGDTIIAPLLELSAIAGYKAAFDSLLGVDLKSFSQKWKSATISQYKNIMKDTTDVLTGRELISDKNAGDYNISPVISPNGKYLAFISQKDVFTMDLFLADVDKGKIISKLSSTIRNNEIDAFNFIESSGSWSPDSKKFAYIAFIKGENKLIIIDARKEKITDEIGIPGIKALSNPAWSPDGKHIVFTASVKGVTNLYMYDYYYGNVRQLTNDIYAYIHSAFSPDGQYIVFSTDKNILNGRKAYVTNAFDLGTLNLKTGKIKIFNVFPGAGNLNPLFDNKGKSIFFLSDRDGYRNLYRYYPDSNKVYQLTHFLTGISGITMLSQAISLSAKNQLVYTYYNDHKYTLYVAGVNDFKEEEVNLSELNYEAATLPPYKRKGINLVDSLLLQPPEILNSVKDNFKQIPYKSKLKLDYVSNTSVGVAAGRFGAGLAGSVSALFSDMVGNNQVFASAALNGQIYDFGGQLAYLNEKSHIKWGTAISHIPYRYGSYGYKADSINYNGEKVPTDNYFTDIIRLFESDLSVFAYYPISITKRVESGISFSRYGYRIDRYNTFYDSTGAILDESHQKLEAPPGFNLIQADLSYVYDNSYFGVTSPMDGARSRYEIMQTTGDYTYFTTLFDYRKYFFLKPVCLAFRVYNYNRFGPDAESNQIAPLYVAYPFLIRGYDQTTVRKNYVSKITIDQLSGSRLLVTNAEIRIPFTGPKQLSLIRSGLFYTDLAIFFDGGLVWDSQHPPELKWQITSPQDRIPLLSTGLSLRINVFGYMVLEPFYAIPFQNGGLKNGTFGLNFVPGW